MLSLFSIGIIAAKQVRNPNLICKSTNLFRGNDTKKFGPPLGGPL